MNGVKHGAVHAQLLGSVVHEFDEAIRGARDFFGQRYRRVIGRLDHQVYSISSTVNDSFSLSHTREPPVCEALALTGTWSLRVSCFARSSPG